MKECLLCALALAALVAGCKADPAEPTQFFGETEGMREVREVRTFHRTWIKPGVDWDGYRSIVIPPVNTRHLREMSWWEETSLAGSDREGIRELARRTRSEFIRAHRENIHPYHLEVLERPRADSVILEIALIEVVPTKAWLNSVSFVGAMVALDKGTVAMEARLRDGASREVIAKFADREAGKTNLIGNVKDFGWYGHAHSIVREWAEQSVEITNSEPEDIVEDSSPFELKVW